MKTCDKNLYSATMTIGENVALLFELHWNIASCLDFFENNS